MDCLQFLYELAVIYPGIGMHLGMSLFIRILHIFLPSKTTNSTIISVILDIYFLCALSSPCRWRLTWTLYRSFSICLIYSYFILLLDARDIRPKTLLNNFKFLGVKPIIFFTLNPTKFIEFCF